MIRPLDLQNSILQSIASAPIVQRAEEGPRLAAQAAQAAFAAGVTRRDESVAATQEVTGTRIGAKPKERERDRGARTGKSKASFEEVVDGAAEAADEPPHIVDFTA